MIRLVVAAAPLALIAAAPAGPPRPGRWTLTVHPDPIPIPAALERDSGTTLRAIMMRTYDNQFCLSRAQVADPRPLATFVGQKSCTPTRLSLGHGFLTGEANCAESNRPFTAILEGSYTATSMTYTVTRVAGGLNRPGTEALSVTAARTGPCTSMKSRR